MNEGLSEIEVLRRRKKFGENSLVFKEDASWLSILLAQLKSPFIYILVFVGFISLFLGEFIEAVLIATVIILNTLMGFFQEYNAKKILAALRKILKPKAIVIREGERKEIEARELVPGDLVILGSGDRIPADGRLVEGLSLLVNEAILTGEEEALTRTTKAGTNFLFMATTVLSGRGVMEVSAIGQDTEIGKIGKSLAEIKEEKTPLHLKLEKFSKTLVYIISAVCLFIFLVGVFYGKDIPAMLKVSIILAIAAMPEGLPVAITIILALGMQRILKKNGLLKSLLSIETLGSTSVICTDKTGTLTEGMMKVVKTEFKNKDKALAALTLANDQRTNLEVAFWDYLKKQKGFDPQEFFNKAERIYEEPFDSEKKYMLSVNKFGEKRAAFIVGAPEIILSFCKVLPGEKTRIFAKIEEWADKGLKVVGLAFKEQGNLEAKKGFFWLGLVGIEDPLRREAKEAIESAQRAGIKVKIVTGDYRRTAERVASHLGFKLKPENVLEGGELEIISEEELKRRIDDIILFSRVTPHQKQKIVKALQEKGEIVAMTGDGVNDAPALKKADIGVVVGNASEVAKEAGDLILLDSNFNTIVSACEEGRLIFSNIKKVVSYVLSNSFVEIVLIFGAIILNLPAPLTIIQILWIHLICDGPPDIVLGFEPKTRALMEEKPQEIKKEPILAGSMKFLIFTISLTIGVLSLVFFRYFWFATKDLNLARTIAFATVAVVDLIYIFAFKNLNKPILQTENFFKNKYLFLAIAYGFLLAFAAIYLPAFNKILGTVPLNYFHWLLVFAAALLATLWTEAVKVITAKKV